MPDEPAGWPDRFGRGPAERRALLVLSALRGMRSADLLALARSERTAVRCLAAIRAGRAGSAGDARFAGTLDPDRIAAELRSCGARLVPWGSREYPAQLEHLPDPPGWLFVRGGPPPARGGTVAVVGARGCTELGRDLARELGRALAAAGATVVSGAARGIDAAAHEGALEAGGRTVAVLGCGIDLAYPRASRRLLERIRGQGCIVSEYPPGIPPDGHRFPARNRIIAGLCSALVVVEGRERSGSLISARHALELGRDVYAVPGAVNNPLSAAPLALIRDGAGLIRGPDDLLTDLRLSSAIGPHASPRLTLVERAALDAMTGPVLPETVARALGATVAEVVPLLMQLELKGLVRSAGGRYESRLPVGA
ncbi:MAG: DNA-processing protein DprA [Candidatus Velamenicoccus archaeovorus]